MKKFRELRRDPLLKQIEEMLDESDLQWLRDHHFDQLDEKMSLAQLKKSIIDGVKSFADELKLNKILSLMFQDKIHQEVRNLLEQKDLLHPEMVKLMNQLMLNAPGEVTEKVEFLKEAQATGFVNEKKLLAEGRYQNLNAVTKTKYPTILAFIAPTILNATPQISAASIGRGELFFFLFAKNTFQGKRGDLSVNGTEVEVKGRLARMVATKGYATTPSVYKEYFFKELKKKYPKVNTDQNYFNFNNSGIKNLSEVYAEIGDPRWARNHLTTTFKKLYLQAKPAMIKKFVDKAMNKDGTLNVDEFISNFYAFQYDYYKQIDGWAGILYINPKTMNMLYIKSSDALKSNLSSFSASKSFSWKEGRNVTYQLTLK